MKTGTALLFGVAALAATHVVVTRRRTATASGITGEVSSLANPDAPCRRVVATATTLRSHVSAGAAAGLALLVAPTAGLSVWLRLLLLEVGSTCSLATAYALLATAIGLLATAVAAAAIFFNIPGLAVAIAATATVSFVLVPRIRAEIEGYDRCMGPTDRCRLDYTINALGQVAMLLSIGAWTIALGLQILAALHLASFFLAWLGTIELLSGEALKWSGIAANGAAAAALVGFTTNLVQWQRCHEEQHKRPAAQEPTMPIG
jgi:hypothetical protein